MIFQNMCHIKVPPEDIQFAKKALCTPDMVEPETDLMIGKADIWDGTTVEVRLCGVPGQPAFMAAAVFSCNGKLLGAARTDVYRTSLDFRIGEFEYLVTLHEDKALTKETPAPSVTKAKTPSRSKRGQKER